MTSCVPATSYEEGQTMATTVSHDMTHQKSQTRFMTTFAEY
jgi:hypothetical protein